MYQIFFKLIIASLHSLKNTNTTHQSSHINYWNKKVPWFMCLILYWDFVSWQTFTGLPNALVNMWCKYVRYSVVKSTFQLQDYKWRNWNPRRILLILKLWWASGVVPRKISSFMVRGEVRIIPGHVLIVASIPNGRTNKIQTYDSQRF